MDGLFTGWREANYMLKKEKTDLQSQRLCASFLPLEIRSTAILNLMNK